MRLTYLLFVLFISNQMAAQGYVGLSGSLNNTWIYNSNIIDAHRGVEYRFSLAPTIGISHVFLGDIFRYRTGVNYNSLEQRLFSEYWHNNDDAFLSKTRLDFIEIPFYMGFQNKNNFFFEMGLNAYYLIAAKETIEFQESNEDIRLNSLTHEFRKLTFGFGSAFGKEMNISEKLVFSYSGEFQFGVSDITKQSRTNGIFESELPNSYFNVMAHDGFEDIPQVSNYKASSTVYLGFRLALMYSY